MKKPRSSPNTVGSMMTTPGRPAGVKTKGIRSAAGRRPLFVKKSEKVLPVRAAFHGARQTLEVGAGDVMEAKRNLLRTPDHQALPLLHRLHEVRCLNEGFVCARIQPRDPARQSFDVQLPAIEVGAIYVGDLELAAGRGCEGGGNLDDLIVKKVQPSDGERRSRVCRLFF